MGLNNVLLLCWTWMRLVSKYTMAMTRNFLSFLKTDITVNFCRSKSRIPKENAAENCDTSTSPIQSFVKDFVKDNLKSVTAQIIRTGHNSNDICQVEQGVKKAKFVKKKSSINRLQGATCDLPYSYHETSEVSSRNKFSQKGHRTNRPNYFIAIQVTDSKVLENAKRIQDSILEESPTDLRHMKVDIRKSHITLMAMHLADSVDINSAKQCLDKCLPIVSPKQSGLITLDFEGLNVFSGGSVLFVTVKKNPALQSLISMSDVITKEMKQHGIVGAGKDFVPHMTLMKYRQKKQTQNYAKKIPKEAYSKFVKEYIGKQTINSIQLCKMEGVREDGYYIVEHEVFFFIDEENNVI